MSANGRPAGALVVSLDFELHWGVHDALPIDTYRENLLGVRDAVPALLALFAEHGVHATWAVVGMLFFRDRRELLAGLPSRRPAYADQRLSAYSILDQVGLDERNDPLHFAPSLIERIAAAPGQEIGTHTFSHYYCLEDGQTAADFGADLDAAIAVAGARLGRRPRSIVFPRNQIAPQHLAVCAQEGFVAYRGNPDHWGYRARAGRRERLVRRAFRLADAYLPLTRTRGAGGRAAPPVDVSGSRYLRPHAPALRHLEPLRLRRIARELRRAARRGETYHLWWHPHDFGHALAANLRFLAAVLAVFDDCRDRWGMQSLTMEEAASRELARRQDAERNATSSGNDASGARAPSAAGVTSTNDRAATPLRASAATSASRPVSEAG